MNKSLKVISILTIVVNVLLPRTTQAAQTEVFLQSPVSIGQVATAGAALIALPLFRCIFLIAARKYKQRVLKQAKEITIVDIHKKIRMVPIMDKTTVKEVKAFLVEHHGIDPERHLHTYTPCNSNDCCLGGRAYDRERITDLMQDYVIDTLHMR